MTVHLHEASKVALETKVEFKRNVENSMNDLDKHMNEKVDEMMTDMKQRLMNEDMWEAFDIIVYLVGKFNTTYQTLIKNHISENVNKLDMESKGYNSSLILLLAVLKKIHDIMKAEEEETGEIIESESCPHFIQKLARGQQFGKYALNTYPASWETTSIGVAKEMGIDPENIIFTMFEDEEDLCPKFILFIEHDMKCIVLAIRGTYCPKDVVMDMICDETPYLNGFAHMGILSGAQKVLTKADECLSSVLKEHPNYGLVVTGHSLGAGVAECLRPR